MARRIFGVDFSGAAKAGRLIWLAEGKQTPRGVRILSCKPAADLPSSGADRETALTALSRFIAANPNAIFGCDFPFSLPERLIEATSWQEFLAGFTHASADAFRDHCRGLTNGSEPKRKTDEESKTPWCAFNIRLRYQTFHGMKGLLRPLVSEDKAVILPMQKAREDRPWVIETCPASTLTHLGSRVPYKGTKFREQRRWILERMVELKQLAPLSADIEKSALDNKGGDALDSIIAALATASALREIEAGQGDGHPLEGRVYFKL